MIAFTGFFGNPHFGHSFGFDGAPPESAPQLVQNFAEMGMGLLQLGQLTKAPGAEVALLFTSLSLLALPIGAFGALPPKLIT